MSRIITMRTITLRTHRRRCGANNLAHSGANVCLPVCVGYHADRTNAPIMPQHYLRVSCFASLQNTPHTHPLRDTPEMLAHYRRDPQSGVGGYGEFRKMIAIRPHFAALAGDSQGLPPLDPAQGCASLSPLRSFRKRRFAPIARSLRCESPAPCTPAPRRDGGRWTGAKDVAFCGTLFEGSC